MNPERLIDYLEERKSELDLKKQNIGIILPQLQTMFITEKGETDVQVIKGKNALRTIYKDIFTTLQKTGEKLYALGIEETKFLEYDEIGIKQHILKFKKHKLKELLISKESESEFFKGSQSEYRLIPDKDFNPNPTQIYGDKIALIIWGRPVYGIIIKNKQVADANKKYFKMLWKIAKPQKNN